jgi:hypothetical protein
MNFTSLVKSFSREISSLIIFGGCVLLSAQSLAQDDPAVSLAFKDTLTLPSNKEFDFAVKMKPASEISAISLGFYFPMEYLEIIDMELANGIQGYSFNVADSIFSMAWSSINPISLPENDTIIILKMKTLDISSLSNTIKLKLRENCEFADQSANVIEDVILEIPEIKFLAPNPQDTITGFSVRVFPNPFDDFMTVDFTLKIESKVKLSLYNPDGMEVRVWEEAVYPRGNHQVRLYGSDLSKGIYLLKFEIRNSQIDSSKIIKILSIW